MSKSKLGDVLSAMGLCVTTIFDNDGYHEIRTENTEISPSDIVEIDVEKAKIALCEEWGIEIDELEQEENRYVIEILHILAQADILKFKSK